MCNPATCTNGKCRATGKCIDDFAFLRHSAGDDNGFTDGNGRHVQKGDTVEYRFGARRGTLIHAAHDGDADVRFDDSGRTEVVKWNHLCKVPDWAV